MRDDGLSSGDVDRAILVFHVERAFEHDGEFVECRSLAGLEPSGGTAHVGNASGGGIGVDPPDVFIDEFWFVACGLDASGLGDQSGHGFWLPACALAYSAWRSAISLTRRRVEENSLPVKGEPTFRS